MDVARARPKNQPESRLHIAFEGCDRYLPSLYTDLRAIADVTWDNASFFDDPDSVPEVEEPWLTLLD